MSYSVFNQDGVHLCDIPLSIYQMSRRQSLSAFSLYWSQTVNLVKVVVACIGRMLFAMPVMWFWVLVVCRLADPGRYLRVGRRGVSSEQVWDAFENFDTTERCETGGQWPLLNFHM